MNSARQAKRCPAARLIPRSQRSYWHRTWLAPPPTNKHSPELASSRPIPLRITKPVNSFAPFGSPTAGRPTDSPPAAGSFASKFLKAPLKLQSGSSADHYPALNFFIATTWRIRAGGRLAAAPLWPNERASGSGGGGGGSTSWPLPHELAERWLAAAAAAAAGSARPLATLKGPPIELSGRRPAG